MKQLLEFGFENGNAMDDESRNPRVKSRDIVAVLTLVGYVFVNIYGKWPRWSWVLLIVAVLSLVFEHYPALKKLLVKRKESRDDSKAARKAFPELQEFVRRFAAFTNRQTNDTLHYIVESDIYRGQAALRADCQLPNVDIWGYPREYFSERLERQPKTMTELKAALNEFHYLVGSYNNFCVAPIFETLPANIRAQITPEARAKLNLFQQKFGRYLQDYQLFVERLVQERPILDGTPAMFSAPKPFV